MSFVDHFSGSSLDGRWSTLQDGNGTITVADSEAELVATSAGDAAAIYLATPIDTQTSQVFRILLSKEQGTSDNCMWIIFEDGGPTVDSFGNFTSKTAIRIQVDPDQSKVFLYYVDDSGNDFEWIQSTGAWTAFAGAGSLTPYASGDYLELRLEIDGDGTRTGGGAGWRLLVCSRSQTSTTWSDQQGLTHWARTDWVEFADTAGAGTEMYLVLGSPINSHGGGTTHVEYVEHWDDAVVHGWINQRDLGTWNVGHEVGHGSGRGPFSVPDTTAGLAVQAGSSGSWDDAAIHSPRVLDDTASSGFYYLFYSGNDGNGLQIGVARATSPYGPWTKVGTAPIISRDTTPGGLRQQVFFPHVIRDESESDSSKRYKMLYAAVDDGANINWRVFYAYASSVEGTWTLYNDGNGVDASALLGPSGTPGAHDEWGYSQPTWVWSDADSRWYIFAANKLSSGAWGTSLALGEVGNGEPLNLTLYSSNPVLEGQQVASHALTADLNGRTVTIADTTGYAQDDLVIFSDSSMGSDEYTLSRVRKVLSGTQLELYHAVRGFTTGNSAAIRRWDGFSVGVRHVRLISGTWYLWATVFDPFADDANYDAYFEGCGVFAATALTGPWSAERMTMPLLYPDETVANRRLSVENIALIDTPITRSTSVSATAASPTENLAGASATAASPVEHIAEAEATASASIENTASAEATQASPLENLLGVAASQASPHEHGGGQTEVSATASTPFESVAQAAATAQSGVEHIASADSALASPVEHIAAARAAQESGTENLASVSADQPTPHEYEGSTTEVSASASTPVESLAAPSAGPATPTESVNTAAAAPVTAMEHVGSLSVSATSPTEILQSAAAAEAAAYEALLGLLAGVTTALENLNADGDIDDERSTLLDEIAAWLSAGGITDGGWLIWRGMMPDSHRIPDRAVLIRETGGMPQIPNLLIDQPTFEVRVRGARITQASTAYQEAREKADDVLQRLHFVVDQTILDAHYVSIQAEREPSFLGEDDQQRPVFTCDYKALREVPS